MSKPRLPEFVWQSADPNAEFSPYKATDVHGNSWFMSANRERIILCTRDGRHFEAWTPQDCWNQYLAAGLEFNYQTLLVDALQFAWTQAEAQKLTCRADRFREIYEMARDGKVKVEK